MTEYWELDGFQDLYLEDSWVLGLHFEPGRFAMDLDLVLRESHPEYGRPEPGDQYCYRLGAIVFDGMTEFTWTGRAVEPAIDAKGEADLGSIDRFEESDGRFHVTGEFGRLEIASAPPRVTLRLDGSQGSSSHTSDR